MRVAVLGIGTMGRAVATRLLERGHEVTVWNRSPGREGDLPDRGARVARDIAGACAGAEAVLTTLTADEAVCQVVLGPRGVLDSLDAGAVAVDMSSIHPRTSRELAAALGAERFLDAPILAGPHTILTGEALLIIGGEAAVIERLSPLWSDLSSRVVRGGPSGAGTTLKLVFNLLFLEELACLAEASVLGRAAGIDDALLEELFRASPMVPAGLLNRLDDLMHGDHRGWFPVPLARKDIRLARELGRESGLELQLAAAADALYERAESAGQVEEDVAVVIEAVRDSGRDGRG
jgi:3-hydroxyisobutyrate dehydrogenase-like beta-hydroxyacid dehydrogenase